jgi:hypothetical protein
MLSLPPMVKAYFLGRQVRIVAAALDHALGIDGER